MWLHSLYCAQILGAGLLLLLPFQGRHRCPILLQERPARDSECWNHWLPRRLQGVPAGVHYFFLCTVRDWCVRGRVSHKGAEAPRWRGDHGRGFLVFPDSGGIGRCIARWRRAVAVLRLQEVVNVGFSVSFAWLLLLLPQWQSM